MSVETFLFATNTIIAIIIGSGLIGNIISFIIFSRETFQKNSISTYFRALAIVECLTLSNFAIAVFQLVNNQELADQSDLLCKMLYYIPTQFNSLPAWILVAFSLDKLLSMRTRQIAILKKKWFQWSIVAGIVLFNLVLYIEVPIFITRREISPGVYICDTSTMSFLNIFFIFYLFEASIIPFIIMIISSVLTIRLLLNSRNSIENIGSLNNERKSRDIKYAISSIAINFMFIVFKIPILTFYAMMAFNFSYNVYLIQFGFIFFFFVSSSNFVIHLISNSLFRREFLVFFRLVNSSSQVSSNANLIRLQTN